VRPTLETLKRHIDPTCRFVDGRHINIVVKVVDLRNNGYRDQEHRNRSLQSYKVETAFYHEFGDKLEKVPQQSYWFSSFVEAGTVHRHPQK